MSLSNPKPKLSLESPGTPEPPPASEPAPASPAINWPEFIRDASDSDIRANVSAEMRRILSSEAGLADRYACIALLDQRRSISAFDSDLIYTALNTLNPDRQKDVLLFLLSPGGSIEPAYQISKLCRASAKEKFIVVVPRQAKSAATLIAMGAHEVHMGPLSQLGPIDPQLGGLPALGVVQALESIAAVSEKHPGSAEMFARYLRMALTVEQIGYCERISESAVQYAERLLATKEGLAGRAASVARELVYEYKDHGFVIDLEEAQLHLGSDWILSGTPELGIAEQVYTLFDWVNLWLGMRRKKRLLIVGQFEQNTMIFSDE